MRTIASVFTALLAFTTSVSLVQASVFTSRLTFDGPLHITAVPFQGGGEDQLEDDSVTAFINAPDPAGAPIAISDGDIIWGVINITNTHASGGAPTGAGQLQQITIVYSAKVSGAGSVGGSFNLVPIGSAASDYDLRNLISDSIVGPIGSDFVTGPDDDSIFVVMSNETGTAEVGGINPLSLNALVGGAVDASSVETNITNANGWFGDLVGGLIDLDDFFEFTGSFGLGGSDRAAFTVQEDTHGGLPYLDVDVFDFSATSHLGDVTLDVGTVTIASADQQSRGWSFRDQGTFFVNVDVIPEPMSVCVWAGICAVSGVAIALRRRARN